MEISMKLFEWAESDVLRKVFRRIEEDFQFDDYAKYRVQEKVSLEVADYLYEVAVSFEQVEFIVAQFVGFDAIVD